MSKVDTWFLRRKLHSLMYRHFNTKAESYLWLYKIMGKHHVADMNKTELQIAIEKIPKGTVVHETLWDNIKEVK